MKKFNVVSPKKYTKNNEEKTIWLQVGTITEFDKGNQILELNMFPNEKYCIFEQKPKEDKPQENSSVGEEPQVGSEDLPF